MVSNKSFKKAKKIYIIYFEFYIKNNFTSEWEKWYWASTSSPMKIFLKLTIQKIFPKFLRTLLCCVLFLIIRLLSLQSYYKEIQGQALFTEFWKNRITFYRTPLRECFCFISFLLVLLQIMIIYRCSCRYTETWRWKWNRQVTWHPFETYKIWVSFLLDQRLRNKT